MTFFLSLSSSIFLILGKSLLFNQRCKPFTANDNGGEKLNTPTTTHSLSSGSPDRLVLPAAAETIVRETIE